MQIDWSNDGMIFLSCLAKILMKINIGKIKQKKKKATHTNNKNIEENRSKDEWNR